MNSIWTCNHRTTLLHHHRMVPQSASLLCHEPLANPIATATTTTTPVRMCDPLHERPRPLWDQRGSSPLGTSLTYPIQGTTSLEEGNGAGLPRSHLCLGSTNS